MAVIDGLVRKRVGGKHDSRFLQDDDGRRRLVTMEQQAL